MVDGRVKKYDKLVRDRVHLQIMAKGEYCRWHVAAPDELPRYLLAKLKEEMAELVAVLDDPSKAEEEIADLMEVITELIRRAALDERRLLRARRLVPHGGKVDPEQYTTRLWNSVQVFGTEFGEKETLTRQIQEVLDALHLLFLRSGINPLAVFLHMQMKHEARGGFRHGIILDEA